MKQTKRANQKYLKWVSRIKFVRDVLLTEKAETPISLKSETQPFWLVYGNNDVFVEKGSVPMWKIMKFCNGYFL